MFEVTIKSFQMTNTIIINFRGGIISPGDLLCILEAASSANVSLVRFGLRQQLLIDTELYNTSLLTNELSRLKFEYEIDENNFPNIISSYPAEDIFIRNTWLSEGVYKDILGEMDDKLTLKVNICDSNQSFTPMLTGNINWIASSSSEHFWHLIIRFPKTNIIYEWDQLCYTNAIARVTKNIEEIIKNNPLEFIDNPNVHGSKLFSLLHKEDLIVKAAENAVTLPQFNLSYYEGLNRYNNKYWLGIYRRNELFGVAFLKKLCKLCLDTKLGQLCCTSWKTIIVKGIEEIDKAKWNLLLEEFQINMRHAANELNFQVEDNCAEGLSLKKYLVKHLSVHDTRTFGICFGIKIRKKSEVFSSILIRKRYLINLSWLRLFSVYDILNAKDFNPNERTGEIFSKGTLLIFLPRKLQRSVAAFYKYRVGINTTSTVLIKQKSEAPEKQEEEYLYQCKTCFTVYDENIGEPERHIAANTLFENLPLDYCCPLCEAEKNSFEKIKKSALNLQSV